MSNATKGDLVTVILDPQNPLAQMGLVPHTADLGTFVADWETPDQVLERIRRDEPELLEVINDDVQPMPSALVEHVNPEGVVELYVVADTGIVQDDTTGTMRPIYLLVEQFDEKKFQTIPDGL